MDLGRICQRPRKPSLNRWKAATAVPRRTCMQDLKGRVRLGILLSPGSEVLVLDRRTLTVPFRTFFGVA